MRKLKQKGVERTGTTMAAKMVQQAFGIRGLVGKKIRPNKHAPVSAGEWAPNTALMINIKDPYAWLVSYHAWDRQAKWDGRKIPQDKQPVSFTPDEIRAAMSRFCDLYDNWFNLPYDKAIIRYEDVLEEPRKLYRKMAKLLKARPNPEKMWDATPHRVVHPGRTKMRDVRGPVRIFNRAYYTEKQYLDRMTKEHISVITDAVDWPLLKELYEPLS